MLSGMYSLHWILAALAYGLLLGSFFVSLGLIFQDWSLRRARLTLLNRALPALVTLDRLQFFLVLIGFCLLALGVLIGAHLSVPEEGQLVTDPRVVGSLVTLGIYGAFLVGRWLVGFRGRKAAWLSVVAFVSVILSTLLAGASFHNFSR